MCLPHIHNFLVLTLSLGLVQMSVALAADWTPLEICALIQEKYPQFPIHECTEDNIKQLTKPAHNFVALGFDPSKDLPFYFKEEDEDTNNDLTEGNISRRQAEPEEPPGDSSEEERKERIRAFVQRVLPTKGIANRSEADYGFRYESLLMPAALPKLYELLMERYFNSE